MSNKYNHLRELERWRDFALPEAKVFWSDVHGLVQKIVMAINAEIAPDIIALDGEDVAKDKTDSLILYVDGRTSVVPLRFTRNIFTIDGTPVFVACESGVMDIVNAIIAELERLHWCARN